jgi:hypothetical protein
MHFPVSVGAGGSVNITADRTAGRNAVIAGLFLGGSGTPPPPPPPPYETGVQGNWVDNYGHDGYDIGGWNSISSDLVSMTNTSVTVVQGLRWQWTTTTTDVRALTGPNKSKREATTWYDANQLKLRVDFTQAYSGWLHLYSIDWETTARRQNVSVNDGSSTSTVVINTAFNNGAWMHFPVSGARAGR